jgi:hypothetical protein
MGDREVRGAGPDLTARVITAGGIVSGAGLRDGSVPLCRKNRD